MTLLWFAIEGGKLRQVGHLRRARAQLAKARRLQWSTDEWQIDLVPNESLVLAKVTTACMLLEPLRATIQRRDTHTLTRAALWRGLEGAGWLFCDMNTDKLEFLCRNKCQPTVRLLDSRMAVSELCQHSKSCKSALSCRFETL